MREPQLFKRSTVGGGGMPPLGAARLPAGDCTGCIDTPSGLGDAQVAGAVHWGGDMQGPAQEASNRDSAL